jgi:hypothetical protein
MNGKCFEIGTIQAFLDGETEPEVTLRVTNHIAACDRCATALAEAEEETSVVFATLDREMNTLVPTQRLWSRINETIEGERNRSGLWNRFLGLISAAIANPSMSAAFGVLVIVGLATAVLTLNPGVSNLNQERRASDAIPAPAPNAQPAPPPIVSIATTGSNDLIASGSDSNANQAPSSTLVKETNYSPEKLRKLVVNANYNVKRETIKSQNAYFTPDASSAPGYLPGEESYVKTIAELRQNVDGQKDTVLPPSSRVSYERDMAVVDDSIKKMRQVVKKNPRNQAAKQVLYSSYQDKIDLLNSVAQREDLVASLR